MVSTPSTPSSCSSPLLPLAPYPFYLSLETKQTSEELKNKTKANKLEWEKQPNNKNR